MLDFSNRTRTGISKLISRCAPKWTFKDVTTTLFPEKEKQGESPSPKSAGWLAIPGWSWDLVRQVVDPALQTVASTVFERRTTAVTASSLNAIIFERFECLKIDSYVCQNRGLIGPTFKETPRVPLWIPTAMLPHSYAACVGNPERHTANAKNVSSDLWELYV